MLTYSLDVGDDDLLLNDRKNASVEYPQDPRTTSMLGRIGTAGQAVPVTRQDMVEEVSRWPVSEHTPEAVAEQLRVARDLFVHCLLVWEFGTVGAAWSLMAVESCVRWALDAGEATSFKRLVERAHRDGLLTDDLAKKVDAGRRLRNMFSHPKNQQVWPLGMTGGAIEQSHLVVSHVSGVVGVLRGDERLDGIHPAEKP